MIKNIRKNKKGFTMIELIAVVVILAVLMLIAIPGISKLISNTKQKAFYADASNYVKTAKKFNVLSGQSVFTLEDLKTESDGELNIKSALTNTDYVGIIAISPKTGKAYIYLDAGCDSGEYDCLVGGYNDGTILVPEEEIGKSFDPSKGYAMVKTQLKNNSISVYEKDENDDKYSEVESFNTDSNGLVDYKMPSIGDVVYARSKNGVCHTFVFGKYRAEHTYIISPKFVIGKVTGATREWDSVALGDSTPSKAYYGISAVNNYLKGIDKNFFGVEYSDNSTPTITRILSLQTLQDILVTLNLKTYSAQDPASLKTDEEIETFKQELSKKDLGDEKTLITIQKFLVPSTVNGSGAENNPRSWLTHNNDRFRTNSFNNYKIYLSSETLSDKCPEDKNPAENQECPSILVYSTKIKEYIMYLGKDKVPPNGHVVLTMEINTQSEDSNSYLQLYKDRDCLTRLEI